MPVPHDNEATAAGRAEAPFDEARAEAFAGRLFEVFSAGLTTCMVDLSARTGLFDALLEGPSTSAGLAARAGLVERYVQECLGALVTAGIVDFDAASDLYSLPAEHAVSLTGRGSGNLAPMSRMVTLLGQYVGDVARAFRQGGGVPYEAFRPEFTDVMDAVSRGLFDEQLVRGILPSAGDVEQRLRAGIRVADVGCGTGHSTNVLARAFPRSTFIGYDLNDEAIDRARAEAAAEDLGNVAFEVVDVAQLQHDGDLGAVFAFDAIHDQVDPVGTLAGVHRALTSGGVFLMLDIKASSRLEDNVGNPFAPMIYAFSTLHCLTVSLAHGGAGLGAAWGEELARGMLADAGFVDVTVSEVPDDPLDVLYVASKP